ncbi:MAG TPA: purine-nucleoside phosphorylase [Planctomycetaceae bacterium]|nr:purine-nucleoside phosphorylase [Planctomycetaceae bacterium]
MASDRCAAHPGFAAPRAGIILGSGLGGLADEIADPLRIDYADLPGFARATASGHRGQLIFGTLDGVPVVAMAGRMHRYEGHGDDRVTFPVRLMAALGATMLIVSNAAGGLNPVLNVGDIVIINDHIDLAKKGGRTLVAPLPIFGRVASPLPLYDSRLSQIALAAARAGDFAAILGTYIATLGPTYETRAEYRMMRKLGGDVVGMSTAPEVCVAATLGMRVLGLSLVSNVARPDEAQSTDHQDVLDAGRVAQVKLRKIVAATLRHLIG